MLSLADGLEDNSHWGCSMHCHMMKRRWESVIAALVNVPGRWAACILGLAFAGLAQADWSVNDVPQWAQTREWPVLALPAQPARFDEATEYGRVQLEIDESATHRIYDVTLDGRRYELVLPINAPPRYLAFDPRHRAFTVLLPSIRVALDADTDLAPLAEAVRATRISAFEPLGFAFIDLPKELHPLDAVAIIEGLEREYSATVRLPVLKIDWQ